MLKKKLIIGLLVVLNCSNIFIGATNAHITGSWWQSGQLDPLDYYEPTGWSEVQTAETAWNNANVDPGDMDRTYDHEYYDYLIYLTTRDDVSWWGWTTIGAYGNGQIVYCTVELHDDNCPAETDERRIVSMHEMGHVWGLDDEPANETIDSIMNPILCAANDYSWTAPQAHDISGVNSVY